ncbi:MAG: type VI secretion system tube protein Hcp [Desulfamplus sp.]|nr:type VI secretion system tube protein Hcp [Desulfamplus sp.]
MPIPGYMTIDGIPGSVAIKGREDSVEVVEFNHPIYIPVDSKGVASGTRVHGSFTFLKNFDKATPELYKRLCTGTEIPTITLNWYAITQKGAEEIYFVHKLENVKIVDIQAMMPDSENPSNENFKHRERVSLKYEKITWTCKDGNIEYSDSWKERA